MTAVTGVSLALAVAGTIVGSLRWLRVAQREHYLAGSATRFALRWWFSAPAKTIMLAVGVAGVVASGFTAPAAAVPAVVAILGPRRLGVRGRTSQLVWTRRLTVLASVLGLLEGLAVALGAVADGLHGAVVAAACLTLASPALLDLALALTAPFEARLATGYVRRATARLQRVRPVVVAVTGSYGKTTTKGYITHLVGAAKDTLASPQSYNNRAGLSRTVNEHLGPATEVLVAEMGAYGPGEIAEICTWMTPDIAVITAIGPAHLERFKSLERTLQAKAEITERAPVVVLNIDDERLAGLAKQLESTGKRVVRASGSDPQADVAVLAVPDGIELRVGGRRLGKALTSASDRPTALSNAACAVAVALELDLEAESLLPRLATLPLPANRLQRYVAEGGYVVLDDTFNSNPAGARLALARLELEAPHGRRVLVTPGMVELGKAQEEENAALGEAAAAVVSDVVVVARTNRRALSLGARRGAGGVPVVVVDRLDEAVAWARGHLGSGDAVLY
ncbi:MAG TPA: Mur ligase family protein, partial [Acidimicrobiales bacterium]|nr:Mur ligase family protein [Acidimicrobiales bacterium]